MLKNDINSEKVQIEQRILIENGNQTDKEQNNDLDGQIEVIEIRPDLKSKQNSPTNDELQTKCQNLELQLNNAKQNLEKVQKQNKNYLEKIKSLEEQEKNLYQCIDQNVVKSQNLEENNQLLESQLQKQQEKILSLELIIKEKEELRNNFEIQINEYIQENNELRSQFQEQNQLYQMNVKMAQDFNEMFQKIQLKKCIDSKNHQKLNEKLQIKDKVILYLQNQLADLRVSQILANQENSNKTKLNTNTSEKKNVNNIQSQKNNNKCFDQLLIKSQTLNSKVLPPKDDQKMVQSQFTSQQEKQKFYFSAQNNQNNPNYRKSNESLTNINDSITESIQQNLQANSHRN